MKVWPKNRDILQFISLVMLLGIVLLTYSNRVDDLDLWWHLKAGEVVVQDLSLPDSDPFSYTTGATVTLSEQDLRGLGDFKKPSDFKYWGVSLSHSWLGQSLLYLAYAAGGFYGVGLIKVLIFMATFMVLYGAMRCKGAGPTASLLVTLLAVAIGQDFAYSRPQIFTFLLLAVLFYLFADFKGGGRKFLALPFLFLLWSNIHGGFVVGAYLLLIFWASETTKYLLHNNFKIFGSSVSPTLALREFSFYSLLSFLAMMLNPNHYKIFLAPLALRNSLFASIEEYVRPMLYEYHAYWLMLALVLLMLILLFRENDPTDVLLIAFLAISSQMGIRGIILFAIGSAPYLATSLSYLWQWLRSLAPGESFFSRPEIEKLAAYRPQQFLLIAILLLFGVNQAQAGGFLNFSVKFDNYPVSAVNFLKSKDFPGRIFNPYNWGGYLIWKYPQRQVFIDGRCLDEKAFFHYQLIIGALGGQATPTPSDYLPLWKKLLDEYDVQVVLTNAVDSTGDIVPLVDILAFDPDWALVYQDGTSLIFLRDIPINRSKFGSGYLNKKTRIYDEIISEGLKGIAEKPATWGYYELLGSVYLSRREMSKAREMLEKYLQMNPNNIDVIQNLNMIRQMKGETPLPVPRQPASPHGW